MDTIANIEKKAVQEKSLISMTIAEYCREKGLNSLAKTVGTSVNDVPFITFLHATEKTEEGKTKAYTYFFSKRASEKLGISKGDVVDKDLLTQIQFCYAQCESAEEGYAWKLSLIGDSEASPYQNVFNLLA